MKIIDLSQTMVNRMQTYPGDIPPMLHISHSIEFDGYTNYLLTTGMHIGTHIDGPLHMVSDSKLICDIPVENFTGIACAIDISQYTIFDNTELIRKKAAGCSMVLFYTGYGKLLGTPEYLTGYPFLGENVANTLVEMNIKLIGIDTLTPDADPHQTHKILLGGNILIAENLTNIDMLLKYESFTVIALPLKIEADSAPARVIALVE